MHSGSFHYEPGCICKREGGEKCNIYGESEMKRCDRVYERERKGKREGEREKERE